VIRRSATVLVVGLAAALTLSGCGAQDSTGRITVTVSQNEAEHQYRVEVLVPNGRTAAQQRAFPGDTLRFAGIAVCVQRSFARTVTLPTAMIESGKVTDVTLSSIGC
jgi:hypothetical protein